MRAILSATLFLVSIAHADTGFMGSGMASNGPSVVVKNPYQNIDWNAVHQFVANFHFHTVASDGRGEPGAMIHAYAEAGYQILAITDHDNYHTVRDGERVTEPTAETTWPWTKYSDASPSRTWQRGNMETAAFFPDLGEKGMLAIRGNELSTDPHIVSLFSDCGWLERGGQTDDERFACVSLKNGLAWYAHPTDYAPEGRWAGRVFEADWESAVAYYGSHITRYPACLGIEMQLGRRRSHEIQLLNMLLEAYYRDHDFFIYGGDDNHSTNVNSTATVTFVLAPALTEEAVRHALQHGHVLVGSRSRSYPVIKEIRVDQRQQQIILEIDDYDSVLWLKDGLAYAKGVVLDYSQVEDAILRFEINYGGRIMYSQPFHIQKRQ